MNQSLPKFLSQVIKLPLDMFFEKKLNKALCLLFFVGLVSSCKIAEPPKLPSISEMPATFPQNSDSASIGDIPWDQFFSDPHLVDLIDIGLRNNLDLLIAIQRVEMARADYQVRRGALLPTLTSTAAANFGSVRNETLRGTPRDQASPNFNQDLFIGFQSTWEADIWGRLRNMKKAAYYRYMASVKGHHLVRTALVAEIASMYYELLTLDNELEVVHRNIQLQETALEIIKIQKIGGRATELAVQQFQAQLLGTRTLEAGIQQQIVEVENLLNLLLGRYPEEIVRGRSILEQPLPESVNAGLPSDILLRRPDIQQAELQLLAAKADIEAARAAFLPSVLISPYVGFNAANAAMLFKTPESLAIGILGSLTAPIFNRRLIRSNFDRAAAQNMEAVYSYQEAIISGYQDVVTGLRSIHNYENMYGLKEQEVEVLQSAVSTANDLYASGYASYLEVITAQRRVLEAELERANIRMEIFISVIELYRSLGGGWKEDNL